MIPKLYDTAATTLCRALQTNDNAFFWEQVFASSNALICQTVVQKVSSPLVYKSYLKLLCAQLPSRAGLVRPRDPAFELEKLFLRYIHCGNYLYEPFFELNSQVGVVKKTIEANPTLKWFLMAHPKTLPNLAIACATWCVFNNDEGSCFVDMLFRPDSDMATDTDFSFWTDLALISMLKKIPYTEDSPPGLRHWNATSQLLPIEQILGSFVVKSLNKALDPKYETSNGMSICLHPAHNFTYEVLSKNGWQPPFEKRAKLNFVDKNNLNQWLRGPQTPLVILEVLLAGLYEPALKNEDILNVIQFLLLFYGPSFLLYYENVLRIQTYVETSKQSSHQLNFYIAEIYRRLTDSGRRRQFLPSHRTYLENFCPFLEEFIQEEHCLAT